MSLKTHLLYLKMCRSSMFGLLKTISCLRYPNVFAIFSFTICWLFLSGVSPLGKGGKWLTSAHLGLLRSLAG